jgi:hypothetical protein
MAYTKKRVRQHIMEDQSIRIVRDLLPDEWVVREYRPDYGIDLAIELFEFLDAKQTVAASLGETLFVQVKSTEVVRSRAVRVYGRRNVEKGPLAEDRNEYETIEVARLQLETSELLTIQAMGAAIPVMLFLVELSTRRMYFVCLNDLIEKVVLPEDPLYHEKKTKTILIPLRNRVTEGNAASVLPLATYAKRPKLYAAFEKFGYQQHEIGFAVDAALESPSPTGRKEAAAQLLQLVQHFLATDLRYDFWTRMPEWQPIRWAWSELSALAAVIQTPNLHDNLDELRSYLVNPPGARRDRNYFAGLQIDDARAHFYTDILMMWNRLDNLSRMYEELVREWFLPTYLAGLLTEDLRES